MNNWLDKVLEDAEMSPAQLAKEAHLDQGLISRLRRNLTKPTFETLQAIARATRQPIENIYRMVGYLPAESPLDTRKRRILHKLDGVDNEEDMDKLEKVIDVVVPNKRAQEPRKHAKGSQHSMP